MLVSTDVPKEHEADLILRLEEDFVPDQELDLRTQPWRVRSGGDRNVECEERGKRRKRKGPVGKVVHGPL